MKYWFSILVKNNIKQWYFFNFQRNEVLFQTKKISILKINADFFCTPEEIRTLTPLQAPPPQGGVSTNSTTEA